MAAPQLSVQRNPQLKLGQKIGQINWGLVLLVLMLGMAGCAMLYSAANGNLDELQTERLQITLAESLELEAMQAGAALILPGPPGDLVLSMGDGPPLASFPGRVEPAETAEAKLPVPVLESPHVLVERPDPVEQIAFDGHRRADGDIRLLDHVVACQCHLPGLQGPGQLDFIQLAMARDQDRHRFAVGQVDQGLDHAGRLGLQHRGNLLDGARIGGVHTLQGRRIVGHR